jgi:Hint domain
MVALVASCTSGQPSSPASPPAPPLTTSELKIRLIEELGPLWYCDPDFYPIAVFDEADQAKKRFGEVQADQEAFNAITAHLGLAGGAFTDDQKLTIYQLWKRLNAIVLEPADGGTYRFDYLEMPPLGASEGRRTAGTIDGRGAITVEQQAPAGEPPCPICLARGTRIATPDGQIPIEDIRVGMSVWSIDAAGRRFVATVAIVGRTPVPATHRVVRLVLDHGRVLHASPGHPLSDGRLLGSIRAGDRVDGATVVSAILEPYDGGFTFDLLPDGPTGTYIADGIPLGSTLGHR